MKRSGRKSAAQTPAPPSERIKGSKRNPKGSAASSESANKINLSENIVKVLKDKADAYNEKHPKNKVSVSTLKAVFRRGAGAYSSSHRPTITGGRPNSRTAWAYARVNKFLLKKGGTKVKAAYVQDDDLMAKGGLIAPNGNKSNLTPQQHKLVRTPEFKAWFGDWENDPKNASKVVDDNGEPKVVYHYSPNEFTIFNPSYQSRWVNQRKENVIWFGGNDKVISYNQGEKGFIYQCFLNVKKPIIVDAKKYDEYDYYKDENGKKNYSIQRIKGRFISELGSISWDGKRNENDGVLFLNAWDNINLDIVIAVPNPNQIKLADGTNTTFDVRNPDIRYDEGGEIFKPTMTIQELADKYGVSYDEVDQQLDVGIEKELEHTNDKEVAQIIALHHIEERLNYYDILKENQLEEGAIIEEVIVEPKSIVALPDTYADIETLKPILAMQGYEIKPIEAVENEENEDIMKKGGVVVGKSHQEADENGTGEKFVVASTGQIVELEGGEAVIVNKAMDSSDMLKFEGKEMTPKEIASYLNHAYGGVKFEQGGEVTCGCSHKKYYHGGELPSAVVNGLEGGEAVITKKTMESNDKYVFEGQKLTPRQILSRINRKYGGVSFARGGITGKVKHSEENKMSKMIYFINNVNYG